VSPRVIKARSASEGGAGLHDGGGLGINSVSQANGVVNEALVNDTFFQNLSSRWGGGLNLVASNTPGSSVELTSNTFYRNVTSTAGGAVYLDTFRNIRVDNNIFDGNLVTAQGFNGPLDVALANGATLNDLGYNLVGVSDSDWFDEDPEKHNIFDLFNNPGLANALGPNGALVGYPPTLALLNTSPGFETGDQSLATRGTPWSLDARGYVRQAGHVSIGAENPDALGIIMPPPGP
jgi:hypothetical protein